MVDSFITIRNGWTVKVKTGGDLPFIVGFFDSLVSDSSWAAVVCYNPLKGWEATFKRDQLKNAAMFMEIAHELAGRYKEEWA